jgi:hypothetical protein
VSSVGFMFFFLLSFHVVVVSSFYFHVTDADVANSNGMTALFLPDSCGNVPGVSASGQLVVLTYHTRKYPFLKIKSRPGVVAHSCNPAYFGGGDQDQPCKTLARPHLNQCLCVVARLSSQLCREARTGGLQPGWPGHNARVYFRNNQNKNGWGCGSGDSDSLASTAPYSEFNPKYRKKEKRRKENSGIDPAFY